MTYDQNYITGLRWVPCVNSTGADIPPYSLVELEGTDSKGFVMLKPRESGCLVAVTGPVAIPSGKLGQATYGDVVLIAVNAAAAAGEFWGPDIDQWDARKGRVGFKILQNSTGSSNRIAWAQRSTGGSEIVRWVNPDSSGDGIPVSGTVPAMVQKKQSNGYVDDYAVRLKIRAGTVFVTAKPILATLNGYETYMGTKYELYHANGNTPLTHKSCDPDDPDVIRCFKYYYPEPFAAIEVDCETGEPIEE